MSCPEGLRKLIVLGSMVWLLGGAGLGAQSEHAHDGAAPDEPAWMWSWNANVFFGWNYQLRKFTDFQRVESQNWFMGGGERQLGAGRLRLHTMLSLEPFTIQPLGSPEVFQTGETYKQAPLIDYQHPHDLFMDLGATYTHPIRHGRTFAELAVVGSPALGPTPFMHRPSAAENPTVPLSHHQMDATHITHGVITGGITQGELTFAGSWFRGAEPDENRKDIELGALDSYSGQVSWTRGGCRSQFSAAHLTKPEWVEPFYDMTRITASIEYTSATGRIATLWSWGQNREIHGILDAYLFEATLRSRGRQAWYTRAELAVKDILGAGGRHPPGFVHFHPLSRVGGFTAGYVFDVLVSRAGRFGIGGDATVYRVPPNLLDNYGAPASFHVFLRYRPDHGMTHMHN
jgi:hypothetical protein